LEVCSSSLLGGGSGDPSQNYPDIADGGQVTVVNSQQQVIGDGTLSAGAYSTGLLTAQYYNWKAAVPGGLPRYGVEVGTNRGTVWFSQQQMKAGPSTGLGC